MGDAASDHVAGGKGYATDEILGECRGLLGAHDALGRCVAMHPRAAEAQKADFHLRFGDRQWLKSATGQELIAFLLSHPSVAAAEPRRSDLFLTFETDALRELESPAVAGRVGRRAAVARGRVA